MNFDVMILNAVLSIITTILVTYINFKFKKFKSTCDDMKYTGYGIRELLKKEIDEECSIAMDNGFCSDLQKERIYNMFEIYTKLHGNGRIKQKVEQIFTLPTN